MEPEFWHGKWERDETGFHKSEAHPLLVAHLDALRLSAGARVFLPLCGMTLDIPWLMSRELKVVGVELSEKAVKQVFDTLGVEPEVTTIGALKRYRSEGIDLYAGDVFDITAEVLGPVDAIYDRAACVALPDDMRTRYADHLSCITAVAPQLLITFDYDQSAVKGPPFSVAEPAVRRLYERSYSIKRRASVPVEGGLKGQATAMEEIWILRAL